MSKVGGIVAVALVTIGAGTANADLLVYESFNYAADTAVVDLPATGQNLTGNYVNMTIQNLVIRSPGLTYGSLLGNLPSVAGNRLSDPAGVGGDDATVAVDQDVATGPGSAIYFSALFTFDDSTNGNRAPHVTLIDPAGGEIGFGEAGVGVRAIRITANTASTGGLIAAGADSSFTDGQTLWLIGRYINGAAAASDSVELIGYDTAVAQSISSTFNPADPAAKFAYALTNENINFTGVSSIRFDIRGDDNNFIDELRIGTTYADITAVPEPATAATLGVALATALVPRRRRRA